MTLFWVLLVSSFFLVWFTWKDPRFAYLLLLAGVFMNLVLPFELFDQVVTTQRLAALFVFPLTLAMVAVGRLRLYRLSGGQKAFLICYSTLALISLMHLIDGSSLSERAMLGHALNMCLFLIVTILVSNMDVKKRHHLLRVWAPLVICAITATILASYVGKLLSSDFALDTFRQTYRLKGDFLADRNTVNVWGAAAVLMFGLVGDIWRTGQAFHVRVLALCGTSLLTAAVVVTFSRAAMLALVVVLAGTFVLSMLASRRGNILVWAALMTALLIAFALLAEMIGVPVIDWLDDRISPVLAGSDPSMQVRFGIYEHFFTLVGGAPVFGYGESPLYRLPENTLIYITLQYGLVGATVYVISLALMFTETYKRYRNARNRHDAIPWLGLWGGYVILLLTNDFLFLSAGTFILATMLALGRGAARIERPPQLARAADLRTNATM